MMFINMAIAAALIFSFLFRGATFKSPWTGPEIATLGLAIATIVLGAVALFVALLAVWGYTALEGKAIETAEKAGRKAAQTVVRNEFRAILNNSGDGRGPPDNQLYSGDDE